MTDRWCFLPISPGLLDRMKAASERVERDTVVVLFDGTKHRPWGMYLAVERESEYAARQRPLRDWRDLDADDIDQILEDVSVWSHSDVAIRHHVHPETVNYLVIAVQSGVLVRRASSTREVSGTRR